MPAGLHAVWRSWCDVRRWEMWLGGRRGWWWGGREIWLGALCVWLLFTAQLALLTRHHPHPALTRSCYPYNATSLRPQNLCCTLHNYTRKDVTACVRSATNTGNQIARQTTEPRPTEHFRSPNQYLLPFHPSRQPSTLPSTPGKQAAMEGEHKQYRMEEGHNIQPWVWAFVGDSRMRQVFSALVTLIASPRVKYRKPSTGGKWRSVHELKESLRIGKLHEDIYVQHQDLPLSISFHWDPLLLHLPTLINTWTTPPQQMPSLLLLGSGLHWMRQSLHTHRAAGSQAALHKFQRHLESLRPHLALLTPTTHIVIQILDHIQESGIFSKYRKVYSNHNIDQYNNLLSSYIAGSPHITAWDSNVPLSDLYHATCHRHNRTTFDMRWSCNNPLHTGYVMVEKYANMLLNDVCNPYIDLGTEYC